MSFRKRCVASQSDFGHRNMSLVSPYDGPFCATRTTGRDSTKHGHGHFRLDISGWTFPTGHFRFRLSISVSGCPFPVVHFQLLFFGAQEETRELFRKNSRKLFLKKFCFWYR